MKAAAERRISSLISSRGRDKSATCPRNRRICGDFGRVCALAIQGANLLNHGPRFSVCFQGLAIVQKALQVIRAPELKLYILSRCENWTEHARKNARQ